MDKCLSDSLKHFKIKKIPPEGMIYMYEESTDDIYITLQGEIAFYLPKNENNKLISEKYQDALEKNKMTLKSLNQLLDENRKALKKIQNQKMYSSSSDSYDTDFSEQEIEESKNNSQQKSLSPNKNFSIQKNKNQQKQQKNISSIKNLEYNVDEEEHLMLDEKILIEKIRVQTVKKDKILKSFNEHLKVANQDYYHNKFNINFNSETCLKLITTKNEQQMFGHHSYFIQKKRWQTVANYNQIEDLYLLEINAKKFHQIFYPVLEDIFYLFESLMNSFKLQKQLADSITLGFQFPEQFSLKQPIYLEEQQANSLFIVKQGMVELVKRFQMKKVEFNFETERTQITERTQGDEIGAKLKTEPVQVQEKQLSIIQKLQVFGYESLLLQAPSRFCSIYSTSYKTFIQRIQGLIINKIIANTPDQQNIRSQALNKLTEYEKLETGIQKFIPGTVKKQESSFKNVYKIFQDVIENKKCEPVKNEDHVIQSKGYLTIKNNKNARKEKYKNIHENSKETLKIESKDLFDINCKLIQEQQEKQRLINTGINIEKPKKTGDFNPLDQGDIDHEAERIRSEQKAKNVMKSFTSFPHHSILVEGDPEKDRLPSLNKNQKSMADLHRMNFSSNQSKHLVKRLSNQLFNENIIKNIVTQNPNLGKEEEDIPNSPMKHRKTVSLGLKSQISQLHKIMEIEEQKLSIKSNASSTNLESQQEIESPIKIISAQSPFKKSSLKNPNYLTLQQKKSVSKTDIPLELNDQFAQTTKNNRKQFGSQQILEPLPQTTKNKSQVHLSQNSQFINGNVSPLKQRQLTNQSHANIFSPAEQFQGISNNNSNSLTQSYSIFQTPQITDRNKKKSEHKSNGEQFQIRQLSKGQQQQQKNRVKTQSYSTEPIQKNMTLKSSKVKNLQILNLQPVSTTKEVGKHWLQTENAFVSQQKQEYDQIFNSLKSQLHKKSQQAMYSNLI